MAGGDPDAAGAAKDVAVLLASVAHGGGVDDRHQLLDVAHEETVEEHFVAILERGQSDVALERILLAHDVAVDALHLLLEGTDGVGQETFQAEGDPLLAGEGGSLAEHRVAQEPLAAIGHLDPRSPFVVGPQAVGFHCTG